MGACRHGALVSRDAGSTQLPVGEGVLLIAGWPSRDAKPAKTKYALRGHEDELAKHLGHRVEVAGTLAPPLSARLPAKDAKAAESVRPVQVSAIKMVGYGLFAGKGGVALRPVIL